METPLIKRYSLSVVICSKLLIKLKIQGRSICDGLEGVNKEQNFGPHIKNINRQNIAYKLLSSLFNPVK